MRLGIGKHIMWAGELQVRMLFCCACEHPLNLALCTRYRQGSRSTMQTNAKLWELDWTATATASATFSRESL